MDDLGPKQQAIFQAISQYSKSPIDSEHLHIETINGKTCLLFEYQAPSKVQFDVVAEYFEDSYVLYCEGWHEEFTKTLKRFLNK